MHFTKQQRNIIQQIFSKNIWDICSFVDYFQTGQVASFDWNQVQLNFQKDPEVSVYYCPKNLSPTPSSLIREDAFKEKKRLGMVDSEMYEPFSPRLEKTYCHHTEVVCGSEFSFDFYQGVRIVDSFDDIIDFLAIWQFLREHALVLEVGQPTSAETVGLFFRQEETGEIPPFTAEKTSQTMSFRDRRYTGRKVYRLSEEYLEICRDFLGKRLYPTPGLKLFIKNRFRTQDEVAQFRTMVTAWVAIFVSLLVGVLPYLFSAQPAVDDASPPSGIVYLENDETMAASTQTDSDLIISP